MSDARTARAAAADVLANCHELLKDNPTAHMVMGIVQAQAMAALTLATLAAHEPQPAVMERVTCAQPHPFREGVRCSLGVEHNDRHTAHHTPGFTPWH